MGRGIVLIFLAVLLVVSASGCTSSGGPDNAKENNTTYEYNNITKNETTNETINVDLSRDFIFKVHGDTEFWLKPNASASFYVVFNNVDEYENNHTFVSKVFPSAADFDVMAAYQCLHFTTCGPLLAQMRLMIDQPETPIEVNYTRVGLYQIDILVPANTSSGTYMYNAVACKDMPFGSCNETATNFGPTIPIAVHVLEEE